MRDAVGSSVSGLGRVPHRPAIDGLRAIAVVAVVLYHADVAWLPAGFLGVDVFFVISGYLICSLLRAELAATGTISLRTFWLRRARRLLPALAAAVVATAAVTSVLAPDAAHRLWRDLGGVVLYVGNWWQVAHDQSYFESFGRPSPVQHLWSLAVEEQFYLAFPVVLAVVLPRWGRRPQVLGGVAAAAGIASAAAMAMLWDPAGDASRVWFGTDTRGMGLCAGVALAFTLSPARLATLTRRRQVALLDAATLTAAWAMALLMTQLDELDAALYRGGFAACAVASTVLVAAATHPTSRAGAVLAWRPTQWVGTRSYAIYLWHWPVIVLTRPDLDVPVHGTALLAVRLAATAALAELSWRWIEQPCRDGRAAEWWRNRTPLSRTNGALATTGLATVLVAGLAAAAPARPPATLAAAMARGARPVVLRSPAPPTTTTTTAPPPTVAAPAPIATSVLGVSSLVSATDPSPAPDPTTPTTAAPAPPPPAPPPPATPAPNGSVLALGDSVMAAAGRALAEAGQGRIVVDAAVGRQTWDGVDLLRRYRDEGRLRGLSALVWGLGTNGRLTAAQVDEVAELTTGVPRVVLLTVRVPKRWEAETNGSVRNGAPRRPRLRIADWQAASAAPGVISDDGVHPTPHGARVYARTILEQLQSLEPPAPQPPAPAPAPAA